MINEIIIGQWHQGRIKKEDRKVQRVKVESPIMRRTLKISISIIVRVYMEEAEKTSD